MPPLARAVKDSDAATRVAAANGFCALAKKNGAASAPYLRIAARDDRDDVRTAAAACLADVAAADAEGRVAHRRRAGRVAAATRYASAAADALATVGPEAAALALPTLLKLIARQRSAGALERRARVRRRASASWTENATPTPSARWKARSSRATSPSAS